ncbi:Rossmann-like and DUF2520 domain-containing protein [Limnovirga soli]
MNTKDMNVVIIGSGNVATVLAKLIKHAGHTITEIISRDITHASTLAGEVNAIAKNDITQISTDADMYIMAVADSAIATIAEKLNINKGIVVHTSGAVPMQVLSASGSGYGVLYPLQSLRKENNFIPEIPLLIAGNDETVVGTIRNFAKSLSANVSVAGNQERLQLHIAAVIVSNFTNHLYTLTADYCAAEKINFGLLLPLIQEVANRLSYSQPAQMQTGPAIRNDNSTIEKHLAVLATYPALAGLYAQLTKSIQTYYAK